MAASLSGVCPFTPGEDMNLVQFLRRGHAKEVAPIEYLPRLSEEPGDVVNVYIKRDDMLPGCAGGNRTGKLDFGITDVPLMQNL